MPDTGGCLAPGDDSSRKFRALYVDTGSYEPTADIYRLNSQAAARKVREMIEEGVRIGRFRPTDAALAAQTVALVIDNVQSGEILETTVTVS